MLFFNFILVSCFYSNNLNSIAYDLFLKAENYYLEALLIYHNSPTILKSLSDINYYQGQFYKSVIYLERIGWLYFKSGTYDKAYEYIQKSLKINQNNLVILEHLGDDYIKLNELEQALNVYNKILILELKNQLIKKKINNLYD